MTSRSCDKPARQSQHTPDIGKNDVFDRGNQYKSKEKQQIYDTILFNKLQIVQEALSKLDALTAADIAEIKTLKNPSAGVKKVLEAACMLKGQKMMRFRDEDLWSTTGL